MSDPKNISEAMGGIRQYLQPTSTPHDGLSQIKLGDRSEAILRLVEWTETMVQIRLSPEQRAHLITELTDTDLPYVMLSCAGYILASGHIELFNRLDMAAWRKAIKDIPVQIGKVNRFYRQGYQDGQRATWQSIDAGVYDAQLRGILDSHDRDRMHTDDSDDTEAADADQ